MKVYKKRFPVLLMLISVLISAGCITRHDHVPASDRIRPYINNSMYWQYEGEPLLLLGGSSNDNIFQHASADLDEELDRLVSFGGNYIRCTMSSRDAGDVYPYQRDSITNLYDLEMWEDEYWAKLEYFLQATLERKVIVQLEIWATYDFYTREWHLVDGLTPWDRNPFNPKNNVNYTGEETGLSHIFYSRGVSLINPFFYTVLPLSQPYDFDIKPVVLAHQQKFVDKLLSITLGFNHVLYVISNETNTVPEWGIYWSKYIRNKAAESKTDIEVTEMWDTFDPTDGAVEGAVVQNPATHFFTRRASVSNTLYDPENYSYLDISNHNFQKGEIHYKTGLYVWNEVQTSGLLRPINNTKIYGRNDIGVECFWRNIFAGAASARFHRPPWGEGNGDIAMNNIHSLRMLTDSIDFFNYYPSNNLLSERDANEAFCMANKKGEYILYFPSKASVRLEIKPGKYKVRWLNIRSSLWLEPEIFEFPGHLESPDNEMWAVSIMKI